MSPAAVTNGDSPESPTSSAFLNHLASFPFVSDSIKTVQNNPYGSKGIALSQKTYSTVANPILPYLSKPYQYAAPYLTRADQIGDKALQTVEDKFPIIKKPTGELYNDSRSIVFFPLKKGMEGKEHLFKVYGQEMKKQGGEGLVVKGKAAVVTGLMVTSDVVAWLGRFLAEKKKETKEVVNEKMSNGHGTEVKGEKWW